MARRKTMHDPVGVDHYDREPRAGEGIFDDMLHEDHNEPANLPKQVIDKEVGCSIYEKDYYYDDGMRGIDDYARENVRKVNKGMRPRY